MIRSSHISISDSDAATDRSPLPNRSITAIVTPTNNPTPSHNLQTFPLAKLHPWYFDVVVYSQAHADLSGVMLNVANAVDVYFCT